MSAIRLSVLLTLGLLATACIEDVGTGKVAATVEEAPAAPVEAEPANASAITVPVDKSTSKVHALGAKITAKHPIDFDEWSGTMQKANGQLVGLEITIQMASLRADVVKLTAHLKKDDFFGVDTFPTSTFKSTSVEAKPGEDGATHVVSGDLTMHGKSLRLSFPATVVQKDGKLQTHAEFVIDRQDFGITYPGRPDDLVQDNVVLTIDLNES